MRNKDDYLVPLADEGITEKDIKAFWDAQPFDLAIPNFAKRASQTATSAF